MATLTRAEPPAPERQRREALVREVRTVFDAATGPEGSEHRAAQDAWVRGEMTLDELIERVQR